MLTDTPPLLRIVLAIRRQRRASIAALLTFPPRPLRKPLRPVLTALEAGTLTALLDRLLSALLDV